MIRSFLIWVWWYSMDLILSGFESDHVSTSKKIEYCLVQPIKSPKNGLAGLGKVILLRSNKGI